MPNLNYDPKNPSDLLDRPIAESDIVAWGTSYGRSPALCIARIEKIRFTKEVKIGYDSKKIECPQHEAEEYTLRLQPLKSTGSTTIPTKYHPKGFIDSATGQIARYPAGAPAAGRINHFEQLDDKPKIKTVHLVKNVVKLEAYSG